MYAIPFLVSLLGAPQSADDYAAVWDKCANAIKTTYYARASRKQEMEARLERFAPIAKIAKNRDEFDAIMDKMIEEFKDSHFDFFTDHEQGYYMMDGFRGSGAAEMPHIGAWFKKQKDGYAIQMLLEGMPAAAAGLRKGDVVKTVDGAPFSPIESLQSKVDKEVTLGCVRGGKPFDVKVTVRKQKAWEMFLEASRNSVRVIEYEGKKIGYMHLWTMVSEDFKSALASAVYGPLRDTDGMILDIRDGFGGRPEGFGDPFFRPDSTIGWKFSETSPPSVELFGYGRPMALIINEGSRSAKEVFSAIIKKSGRAVLVGHTTGGFVLGTGPNRVSEWAYLEIPMVDVLVNGERLEGKGVPPDIPVAKEIGDDGTDLHLQAALKAVRTKIK